MMAFGGWWARLSEARLRRRLYAAAALLLAVLAVVPQPYVARAKLVPQDSNSLGLGSMMSAIGGQLQGFAALLGGGRQPVDFYLAIARGAEVRDDVIERLKLVGPGGYASADKARLALIRDVDIHSLTGGIVEIEVETHSAARSEALTAAYLAAITERIRALGHERIERKRELVLGRFREASARVAEAEQALNAFRKRNNLAEPEAQLGSELSLRVGLQAQLQAKQVQLDTLAQFQGPDNPEQQALRAEIASLRAQIGRSTRPDVGAAGPNVAGLSDVHSQYLNLYRDYRFAQALYEIYARSSEQVTVESLASESVSDVQVIEAPRLDPDRKYNLPALALLALLALLAFFTEIYAPATGIRLWKDRG
ncbi:capsule biosynthesis protein [Sandaracinobacter sp. RS1-74]|uniref:capsule biosynthesis protein n=1 Tax=Sandaracinobacteroides sayramensis TaxID=2913411 RepID=UPI001EDB8515|nr:capsule biosynthesis protein [Sandaracinobacteroides sayramensis]MCG2840508.1 capsule biosynthesis protein [Sandaracinobacteroides sayramensis]